ncbi:MAG: hypothetical protein JJ959_15510 [Nisaea sp.]|uniref:hypothetical protein n=1 Tax=Nisaea sp. TaxID=2024842 RepID=UPI001B299472|nr:hypothetical protein [Nisaea sp.]MBO6561952.1 hypothetical protein [Nisaea sp.]
MAVSERYDGIPTKDGEQLSKRLPGEWFKNEDRIHLVQGQNSMAGRKAGSKKTFSIK